jgi:endoglycosylceramidase
MPDKPVGRRRRPGRRGAATGIAAGVFLAAGPGPPRAHADIADLIIDPIVSAADAGASPVTTAMPGEALASLPDGIGASGAGNVDDLFGTYLDTYLNDTVLAATQAWITSPIGNLGDGGAGSNIGGLPALGGAGGTGGLLGSDGMVGAAGTLPGVAPHSASGSGLPPIETTGSWLTDSDGQVVIMHGLNEVYKLPPYEPAADGFSNSDAAFLAANGFNVVRVGVIWSAVEPEPGVYDSAYLDSVAQTVQILANHGIYSILDMHQDAYSSVFGGEGAPAWATQTGGLPNPRLPFPLNEFFDPAETHAFDAFWSNADAPNGVGLEDDYTQMLEHVAYAFNGNPDVLGFEIMNEPEAGSQTLATLLGSPFFDSQELTPFYDQAAEAIRAVDPTTPILFEPNVLFGAGVPTHLGTVDATGTVFSFHDDCILGALGIDALCPAEDGLIVGEASAYAQAHHIPALLTEIDSAGNLPQITDAMQAADQSRVGWLNWAFSGQGDITTRAPHAESLVYDPELPPVGANVNTAMLTTLAQPYPQVVSGTPNTWSVDNGTFDFSYSTAEVDGMGRFPAGSQTTISAPTVAFPDGYDVQVTGGYVVSAPDAAELVIASQPGAKTITVVVNPQT